MNAITANLRQLANFKGRESRGRFWPYAGFVVLLVFLTVGAAMIVEFSRMFAAMQAFAAQHPEAATVVSGPGHYSIQIEGDHPELTPDFRLMGGLTALMAGAAVTLLAAAVSRRLHDSGLRAYWGILPAPFLTYGVVMMPIMMGSFETGDDFNTTLFLSIFFNNMLYMAALVTLIVLLCRPSTAGPNRYGERPA